MDYIEETHDPGDANEDARPPEKADLRIIDTDLEAPLPPPAAAKKKVLRKRQLVNTLNRINFNQAPIKIHFKHQIDQRSISFSVYPQICFGTYLVCLWQDPPNIEQIQHRYAFQNLLINEEMAVISVEGAVRGMNGKGICIKLPEKALQSTARRARRFYCEGLSIHLVQNGIVFSGHLIDFSAHAFRVAIHASTRENRQWLNFNNRVNLLILKEDYTLYTGECRILKKEAASGKTDLVLEPVADNIQRFCPKQYRSKRQDLTPAPDIVFHHPFTEQLVTLKALNASGSGLCVEDDEDNSVLIPGMIIPELTINLANTFRFHCKAQVIYRHQNGHSGDAPPIQCGVAFLDMSCDEHMRLLSLLHQAENKHLYICNEVDLDQLWRFFFDAGFLYPRKYQFIQKQKENIRKSYAALYTTNSNISRYFTWQQKGAIQGHLSMLRFYENTWLIHHLAALPSEEKRVSIEILKQIGAFTYDSYRLFSSHMDYLICYFRPENRFSNYFFGGVCHSIQNPEACSIDAFAYCHYRPQQNLPTSLPENWQFVRTSHSDLEELRNFYDQTSGGRMLDALDLTPDESMAERHSLSNEYRKHNMKRQRRVYSLKHNNVLKAVFMANMTNFAINLSDLTNSVSIFVIEPEDLPPAILYVPVTQLAEKYEQKTFPVLIYPLSYAEALSYERIYNLWVLNMEYTDDYFKHFERLI